MNNEAFERAKSAYGTGAYDDATMEFIFPDLRESEEEKIRKGLVKLMTVAGEAYVVNSTGIKKDSYLAYLEKQKEQKPAEWDDYTKTNLDRAIRIIKDAKGNLQGYQTDDGIYECDKAIEALEHFLYRGLEIEKPAEWSEDIIQKAVKEVGLTQHQIDWFKTNVFPPKVEWSEEDEERIQSILFSVGYCKDEYPNKKDYSKDIAWLKALPLSLKKRNEDIAKLCSNEWSKEDKQKLNRIYEILGYAADDNGFLTSKRIIGDKEAIELQDFLRSLRPYSQQE